MSGAVEAFLIMVGEVDFLDRPIMAFVRLQNEQFVGKCGSICLIHNLQHYSFIRILTR